MLTGDAEHLSHAFCANSIGSLVRCLFSSFAYFKRMLFSYHSILRIFCIFHFTVLYHLCLLQTFSPSPSFAEQKFLTLTQSSLSIVSFMTCAFHVVPKKSLPNPKSTGFSPLLPSRSQFCFTFRSVTHLELLSMKGVRSVSRFTFFCVDVQVFQQCLLRDHLGSTALILPLHQRSADDIYGGPSVVSPFYSINWSILYQYHPVLLTTAL